MSQNLCSSHNSPCLGICLYPNCLQPQRLLCFECVLGQLHFGHNPLIIDFPSLNSYDQEFVFIQTLKESLQKEQILFNESEINELILDKLFEDLKIQLLSKLEQTKLSMISKLHVINATIIQDNISVASINNQNITQLLQSIKKLLVKFNQGQISSSSFTLQISQLINLTIRQQNDKKINKQDLFDQEKFLQISTNILDNLNNLDSLLTNSYQHIIQFQTQDKKQVILIDDKPNQIIKFINGRSGMIYSNDPISAGVYQLKIRIDKVMEGHICFGLIPEELKEKWSLTNCYPNINLNGIVDNNLKNVKKLNGGWSSNSLKLGEVITINIDLTRGVIQMKDQKDFESCESIIIKQKYKVFRIYIFDYDGNNNELTLLKSGRIA